MMRAAFVLRLGSDTEPLKRHFAGWIEDVDSGEELRFHTTDELLAFLGQRFDLAQQRQSKPQQGEDNTS